MLGNTYPQASSLPYQERTPMSRSTCIVFAVLMWAAATAASAAALARNARSLRVKPTRSVVYKTVRNVRLQLRVFEPEGHKASEKRPAIVFFFGGGWVGGTPGQFYPQCAYLASRGMVAISAEYRVKSRHKVSPFECVTDGKSAVRWVRANAATLGVDPERVAAGGGSAGGHVGACTGTIEGLEEPGEDAAVSSKPNAMVLFNPVLALDFEEWKKAGLPEARVAQLRQRFGGRDPREISPVHHVKAGIPPTIVFHGKADKTVPYATAERFATSMKAAGCRCELVGYDGLGHGFFNFGRGDGKPFPDTMRRADAFLASLGWLTGEPTIDAFLDKQDKE